MLGFLFRYVHQSWVVVGLFFGIVIGMVVGLVFRVNYFSSPMWLGCFFMLLLFSFWQPRVAFLGIAVVSGMILAFFRISAELYGEDYIRRFVDQTVLITGTVERDPESDESGTKIKLGDLKFGEEGKESQGSIYITVGWNSEIARADSITVSGRLSAGFGTYSGYMYKPRVLEIRRPEPGDLVLLVRNWFSERIRRLIQEPEVNLGLSYLLGMKSGLPDDLSEKLRMVGLVHIVVASGAHLSILVEIARKIFGRISRFSGLLFSIIFVMFFMAMVGFTPSILRAGVMSILTLLAWYVGRKFASWRIILIVMAFTLMINPMFIINLGWLLSFASFSGIMILGPRLTRFFYGEKKPGFIAETIITTVSATLMTLPIILYYYGMVSLISVVANLLILPTLSYAMGLVFLTGVVAGIPGVRTFVSFLATKLLDFHIMVVEFFGAQKSFIVTIDPYQPQVFLIYGLVLIPVILGLLRRRKMKCSFMAG